MKKKPVFVFTAKVKGKDLLKQTDQTHTTDKKQIEKQKLYKCEKDCNGVRIFEAER